MTQKLDWERYGAEMREYLANLKPYERPITITTWTDIWSVSESTIHIAFRSYIPEVGAAYRARVTAWYASVLADVEAHYRPGKHCIDRQALAVKYHLDHDQMIAVVKHVIRKIKRRAAKPKAKAKR